MLHLITAVTTGQACSGGLNMETCISSSEPVSLPLQIIAYQPYGRSVDWWAYGVLLYEMLAGQVTLSLTHTHTHSPLLFSADEDELLLESNTPGPENKRTTVEDASCGGGLSLVQASAALTACPTPCTVCSLSALTAVFFPLFCTEQLPSSSLCIMHVHLFYAQPPVYYLFMRQV